jgi:NADH dehydrogenase [ubiquinone] 1 alpha subcomplex assembly factor 7
MRTDGAAPNEVSAEEAVPLEAEIRRRIEGAGSLPVAQYMALCLTHPEHGYYSTRAPIGAGGDFTTAPEISQMFGELIGLWAAAAWRAMGSPENVRLVELGPGRGTMMLDALRAAKVMPAFRAAIVLHMIEVSPVLEHLQRQALIATDLPVSWHRSLEEVPDGPLIILANEFVDALPIHQAVMCADGWHERVIKVDDHGNLRFSIDRDPIPLFDEFLPAEMRNAKIGEIFEWRADKVALEIGRRVAKAGGAALIIDYGHAKRGIGDTLQAVSGHDVADPLLAPGRVDLTAHVDFQALAEAAEGMGARVHGPITQAEFLRRLGIAQRAAALKAGAPPDYAETIDAALERLTNEDRTGMGRLIKVVALSEPELDSLPGFEP